MITIFCYLHRSGQKTFIFLGFKIFLSTLYTLYTNAFLPNCGNFIQTIWLVLNKIINKWKQTSVTIFNKKYYATVVVYIKFHNISSIIL